MSLLYFLLFNFALKKLAYLLCVLIDLYKEIYGVKAKIIYININNNKKYKNNNKSM